MKKERIWLNRRIERAVFILVLLWISVAHSQGALKVPIYIHQKEIWVGEFATIQGCRESVE